MLTAFRGRSRDRVADARRKSAEGLAGLLERHLEIERMRPRERRDMKDAIRALSTAVFAADPSAAFRAVGRNASEVTVLTVLAEVVSHLNDVGPISDIMKAVRGRLHELGTANNSRLSDLLPPGPIPAPRPPDAEGGR